MRGGIGTPADARYANGGFCTAQGNPSQIYFLREFDTTGGVRPYRLDARNPGSLMLAPQMQHRPNALIFSEEQPIDYRNRDVSQASPSLFNQVAQVADGLLRL